MDIKLGLTSYRLGTINAFGHSFKQTSRATTTILTTFVFLAPILLGTGFEPKTIQSFRVLNRSSCLFESFQWLD